MKVKCKKTKSDSGEILTSPGETDEILTVGKEYIVLSLSMSNTHGLLFQIETDDGELMMPDANIFELLSTYIPSNWEIKFKVYKDGSCYLSLAPKKWEEALFNIGTSEEQGFYEEIEFVNSPLENWRNYPPEQIPEVVKLYFQEKDIIYKEEEAYEKASASGFSKPSSILLDLIKNGNVSK